MSSQPWPQPCTLHHGVRSGEPPLAEFAANPNGLHTGEAPTVYHEPGLFARSFPRVT